MPALQRTVSITLGGEHAVFAGAVPQRAAVAFDASCGQWVVRSERGRLPVDPLRRGDESPGDSSGADAGKAPVAVAGGAVHPAGCQRARSATAGALARTMGMGLLGGLTGLGIGAAIYAFAPAVDVVAPAAVVERLEVPPSTATGESRASGEAGAVASAASVARALKPAAALPIVPASRATLRAATARPGGVSARCIDALGSTHASPCRSTSHE